MVLNRLGNRPKKNNYNIRVLRLNQKSTYKWVGVFLSRDKYKASLTKSCTGATHNIGIKHPSGCFFHKYDPPNLEGRSTMLC